VLIVFLLFSLVLIIVYVLTLVHLRKEAHHSYDVEAVAFIAGVPLGFGLHMEVERSAPQIPFRVDNEIVVVKKENE